MNSDAPLPWPVRLTSPFRGLTQWLLILPGLRGILSCIQSTIRTADLHGTVSETQFAAVFLGGLFAAAAFGTWALALEIHIFWYLAALAAVAPWAWLRRRSMRREREITKALPGVMDALALAMDAGCTFEGALTDFLSRRRSDALGRELEELLHNFRIGGDRKSILKQTARTCRHKGLGGMLSALAAAVDTGTPLAAGLHAHASALRSKRIWQAEKRAQEAAIKIIFPTVLCILPATVIILIGPYALRLLTELGTIFGRG